MTRIVLVGAGSVEFTRNLLGDFLVYPELRDCTIVLHDIDPDRLRTAERMAGLDGRTLGASPAIEGHLDRRAALARRRLRRRHHPGRRRPRDAGRLRHPGPLRPALHHQRHHQRGRRHAWPALHPGRPGHRARHGGGLPGRLVPQLHQPHGHARARGGGEQSAIRTVGLCHSVFWTIDTLAGYLGLPREEIDHVSAGVNHLAFLLRLEHRGRDLYPALREFVAAGRVPDDDLVRAELFRRLGYYPTESSEHHAEYNPWFIPKGDAVERYHIPIGEYLDRVAHNLDEYDGDEAAPRRRRALRDRAERRVRGRHRPLPAHRRAGPHRGQRHEPRRAHRRTWPPTRASRCPASSTAPASGRSRSVRCRRSARPTSARPSTRRR